MKPLLLVFVLLLPGPPPTAQTAAATETLSADACTRIEQRCNRHLSTLLEKRGLPGVSAALVLPDGGTLAVAAGFADVEAEKPMTRDDRLLSGSVGKTYVAAAALQLIARGELALDAEAASFFEEDEWFALLPNAETMTVGQLLRHEAGLPRYVFHPEFLPTCLAEPDKVWKPEELLAWVFDANPVFPAGEGWSYADTNYLVIGMILERVTGKPFYDHVQEQFLGPLGLEDTVPSDSRRIEGLTQGYCVALRPFGFPERMLEDGVFCFNPQFEWCGGGYASSASDLARWAYVLYRGEAMEEDYLDTMLDAVPARLGPDTRYGHGVIRRTTELGPLNGHDGIMSGFLATMGYFPDVDVAGAIQLNTDDASALGVPPHVLLEQLVRIALEELE